MKKYFINFVLICSCLLPISNAKADLWDLWADEDEEANMSVGSDRSSYKPTKTASRTSNSSSNIWDLWADEDEEENMKSGSGKASYNTTKTVSHQPATLQTSLRQTTIPPKGAVIQPPRYDNASEVAIYPNPVQGNNVVIPNSFKNNNNDNYNIIDYDTIQAERNIRDVEVLNSIDKWQLGSKSVYWENYRGNNIRIEVLRNNRDLKEMRLKFVQSQDIISDPDGSISDMLNKVAEQVMKRTCGKKAKQSIILYERPSIELLKETSYDNYKIVARGTSLKEYGFRCIY